MRLSTLIHLALINFVVIYMNQPAMGDVLHGQMSRGRGNTKGLSRASVPRPSANFGAWFGLFLRLYKFPDL